MILDHAKELLHQRLLDASDAADAVREALKAEHMRNTDPEIVQGMTSTALLAKNLRAEAKNWKVAPTKEEERRAAGRKVKID